MNEQTRRLLLNEWRGTSIPEEQALPSADLRSAFHHIFKRLGLAERFREATLADSWLEIVGPVLAEHCRPRGIRRGVLTVAVDHSAWLDQITLAHKNEILRTVQLRFPHLKINELNLRIR